MKIKQLIANFLKEEDGITTVEYAVAGGVITSAVVAEFKALGEQVDHKISTIVTAIKKP